MNILVIIGHPEKKSFVSALANSYKIGAMATGAEVKIVDISLYKYPTNIPSDFGNPEIHKEISDAQQFVAWADHIAWFFPLWWADVPSRLKAFFEQVFVSGFAFKYKKSKYAVKWDKFLIGKTAHIFVTMDSPPWYYRLFVGEPAYKMMRYNLKFCGFKKVKRTYFGSVKASDVTKRETWLSKTEIMGYKMGKHNHHNHHHNNKDVAENVDSEEC